MPTVPKKDRDYYNKRFSSLKNERTSFDAHWKEISTNIQPRRGRFFISDRNKGLKKHQAIINSNATQALQIATSGMLAGTMSPTRPWFALETHNPEFMERQDVKEWLFKVEQLIRTIFNESNLYGQAANLLAELLLFGTGAMSHEDDFHDVARFYTYTAGSYSITQNDRFEVDVLSREFEWTVEQIVKAFGYDKCSTTIKKAWDLGNYMSWYPIRHIIEPNPKATGEGAFANEMKFRSVYFEPGSTDHLTNFLRESGFEEFPLYVPRWSLTGEDIYGTNCPGMVTLGDVKSLQVQEKRKAQAIDKMVNPPLTGPASVRNVPVSSLPGGLTVYDGGQANQKLEPLYMVTPQLQELRLDLDAIEQRIDKAFFVDMFLAISNIEGIQPRNQLDIIQRNEERLLQLGPVLERLQGEFLDPLLERTFNQCVRADILPAPPEGVEGEELRVKYISTLAIAQRAVATQSIERMAQYTASLVAAGFESAADKFNADQSIDEMGKAIGAPPSIIVPDEEVATIRQQRAQQQQLEQALSAGQQLANTAKMASDAKTDDESVLTDIAG
jgi:hypothetical protein|tara:strand:- start:9320 stop:10990 length:1671 start_codon:yes stop_codon:yes gene_type:complete